jgi:hypothetical protein
MESIVLLQFKAFCILSLIVFYIGTFYIFVKNFGTFILRWLDNLLILNEFMHLYVSLSTVPLFILDIKLLRPYTSQIEGNFFVNAI